jgi:hypothetical protein
MKKLIIIISTGDKEKAMTALMYSRNVLKNKRFEDVKVVYFGPIEKLMTTDPEVANAAIEVSSMGESFACKAISDKQLISEKIAGMGVKIEYVGSVISDYINAGYIPMVW